jgi:hypothetical protein
LLCNWDEAKEIVNIRKHGISFEAAIDVFDDPLSLSWPERVVNGEERWHTLGAVGKAPLLLVVHTL